MERRTLLSAIVVNTTVDQQDVANSATSVGSVVSLRDAVIVASNLSGATEIDLPAGAYNLANVGTGELQVGNIAGQNIAIKGLGTPSNTTIQQTVVGNRIFNYDNNQTGSIAGSISNVTIENATNVNRIFGGGAIIAGGPGDALTLTNCVVQKNSTSNGTLSVGRNGGAIAYSGGGNLTVTSCQFLNNTAGGNTNSGSAGGAISYNNSGPGNLTISNSIFSNNSVTGVPGSVGGQAIGGALQIAGSGTASIASTTFANNSAGTISSAGGAIYASSMPINIAKSRFFNDTAASGSGIDNAGATITANDDWWGADALPGAAGTDTILTTAGSTTVSTRLALAVAPASSSIGTNSSTTLTAKIVSTSAPTLAVTGTALEGLNLTFAPGTLGSINPVSVAIASGTASTTFLAGTAFGTTGPSVTLDNGTKTTTITVIGAPTANAQSVTVPFNTAKALTLTGSDPNSPPKSLTYTVATNPSHGTLSGTAPNLTYTPSAGFHGADSFTFAVNNGSATSGAATVTLNTAVGTPTANPQTIAVGFSTAKAITLTSSDPDVPALSVTYLVATSPSHGTLSGTAPNLTYSPSAGFHGADSFTFTAGNGTNTSAAATVTLNVAAGTPTANPLAVGTNQDSPLAITLTGSDPDVPALALTYAVSSNPSHGTLSGTAPNLAYSPSAGYSGPDSFQFTASNGINTSAPATISISVAAVPAAVAGTVGLSWGTAGVAPLQTSADGLRLLPAGRNTDIPFYGISKLSITLNKAAALSAGDVAVTGISIANYGPVTVSGSGTSYTLTLAQPITAADRVTMTIGNAGILTFTRRLDVLPGDFNDDGGVTMQDAIGIRNQYLGLANAPPTIFGDVNGDGVVDANDYNLARRLLGTVLP